MTKSRRSKVWNRSPHCSKERSARSDRSTGGIEDSLRGDLRFPAHHDQPYVVGNFVSTLDGVVSFEIPGKSGGGEISGFNEADRFIMGLLRASADAVIVGAGTLREVAAGTSMAGRNMYIRRLESITRDIARECLTSQSRR